MGLKLKTHPTLSSFLSLMMTRYYLLFWLVFCEISCHDGAFISSYTVTYIRFWGKRRLGVWVGGLVVSLWAWCVAFSRGGTLWKYLHLTWPSFSLSSPSLLQVCMGYEDRILISVLNAVPLWPLLFVYSMRGCAFVGDRS